MFYKNLKVLRKRHQKSQQAVSDQLGIKRSTYSGYESGKVEPDIDMLVKLADYFNVSMDFLLKADIAEQPEGVIQSQDASIRNQNFRVLAITTDHNGNENIELIRENAKAGYLTGYADPEFLEEMPKLELPNMGPGTFRGFEVKGDSMWPVKPGDIVVGKYVESARDLQNNRRYVLLTKTEGIVFKRVLLNNENPEALTLLSDNPDYVPYPIKLQEILEAWRYEVCIQREAGR